MGFSTMAVLFGAHDVSKKFHHAPAKSRVLSHLGLLLSLTVAKSAPTSAVLLVRMLSQRSFDQTFSAPLKFYLRDEAGLLAQAFVIGGNASLTIAALTATSS